MSKADRAAARRADRAADKADRVITPRTGGAILNTVDECRHGSLQKRIKRKFRGFPIVEYVRAKK